MLLTVLEAGKSQTEVPGLLSGEGCSLCLQGGGLSPCPHTAGAEEQTTPCRPSTGLCPPPDPITSNPVALRIEFRPVSWGPTFPALSSRISLSLHGEPPSLVVKEWTSCLRLCGQGHGQEKPGDTTGWQSPGAGHRGRQGAVARAKRGLYWGPVQEELAVGKCPATHGRRQKANADMQGLVDEPTQEQPDIGRPSSPLQPTALTAPASRPP